MGGDQALVRTDLERHRGKGWKDRKEKRNHSKQGREQDRRGKNRRKERWKGTTNYNYIRLRSTTTSSTAATKTTRKTRNKCSSQDLWLFTLRLLFNWCCHPRPASTSLDLRSTMISIRFVWPIPLANISFCLCNLMPSYAYVMRNWSSCLFFLFWIANLIWPWWFYVGCLSISIHFGARQLKRLGLWKAMGLYLDLFSRGNNHVHFNYRNVFVRVPDSSNIHSL